MTPLQAAWQAHRGAGLLLADLVSALEDAQIQVAEQTAHYIDTHEALLAAYRAEQASAPDFSAGDGGGVRSPALTARDMRVNDGPARCRTFKPSKPANPATSLPYVRRSPQ